MNTTNPQEEVTIDTEESRLLNRMREIEPESLMYNQAVKNLKELMEAKVLMTKPPISPEAILAAVTNILGILLIINHERLDVITTKAVGFISKGRA